MAKAQLTFILPDEESEFELARKGADLARVLWDFDQEFLRGNIKHGLGEDFKRKLTKEFSDEYTSEESKAIPKEVREEMAETILQLVRTSLWEFITEYECNNVVNS